MVFALFDERPAEGPLRVLTVCTGNICRSPLTETLLRKSLRGLPILLASAGTHALVGRPMTEQNQRIAHQLGVEDAGAHRARQLTSEHLRESDLVLALSREHRREIVELLPRASRYTFTLREIARLTEVIPPDTLEFSTLTDTGARMRELIASLAQLRGAAPPLTDPADDDVIDPYGQPDDVYELSASQIIPAVNALTALLRHSPTKPE